MLIEKLHCPGAAFLKLNFPATLRTLLKFCSYGQFFGSTTIGLFHGVFHHRLFRIWHMTDRRRKKTHLELGSGGSDWFISYKIRAAFQSQAIPLSRCLFLELSRGVKVWSVKEKNRALLLNKALKPLWTATALSPTTTACEEERPTQSGQNTIAHHKRRTAVLVGLFFTNLALLRGFCVSQYIELHTCPALARIPTASATCQVCGLVVDHCYAVSVSHAVRLFSGAERHATRHVARLV